MKYWKLIGGFYLGNWIAGLFSSKSERKYVPSRESDRDVVCDECYGGECDSDTDLDGSDIDSLQERIDELEDRLMDDDVSTDCDCEIQDRIDALQDRIDYLEEMDDDCGSCYDGFDYDDNFDYGDGYADREYDDADERDW